MDFSGGVAAVTGGGSGIGEALCRALAGAGMQVAVIDVNGDRAAAVAERIGNRARPYPLDVTDRRALDEQAAGIERQLGSVNLLCANAGVVMPFGSVIERNDADWQYVLSVNLFGVIHTVDAFIEQLRRNAGNAHILVTSSMGGLVIGGHIPLGPYTVSKYACVGYCEELRSALSEAGIGVSMLAPGVVNTEIMHNSSETRPGALGSQPPPPRQRGYVSPRLAAVAVTPAQTAETALEGMRNNRFYISTHIDDAGRLKDHYDAIVTEMSGQGQKGGIRGVEELNG